MKLEGSNVLLTGANRGIGRAFLDELLRRNVGKIYAGVRSLNSNDLPADPRIVPVQLDLADPDSIEAAAAQVPDVNVLINNAGFAGHTGALGAPDMDAARREMEVNYFGPLHLTRALCDTALVSSSGAIVNVGSLGAYVTLPKDGTYCASKAANLAVTRTIRAELKGRGTRVIAVLPPQVDTQMVADQPGPRIRPEEVAIEALDAVESGLDEVFPGERGKTVFAAFRADPEAVQAKMDEERVTPF